jgi:AraC-like DNA-binding protein
MKNNSLTGHSLAVFDSGQSTQPQPVLAQLRRFILQQLPQAPRLSDAASTLNMSSRTLQRALQQADTSFRQLMCQCRHQLANHYLQDASLSLQQIAFQLGFAEQSSFQKAFKCWQGCSPGVFRQRQQLAANRRRHLSGLHQPGLQVNYGIN